MLESQVPVSGVIFVCGECVASHEYFVVERGHPEEDICPLVGHTHPNEVLVHPVYY